MWETIDNDSIGWLCSFLFLLYGQWTLALGTAQHSSTHFNWMNAMHICKCYFILSLLFSQHFCLFLSLFLFFFFGRKLQLKLNAIRRVPSFCYQKYKFFFFDKFYFPSKSFIIHALVERLLSNESIKKEEIFGHLSVRSCYLFLGNEQFSFFYSRNGTIKQRNAQIIQRGRGSRIIHEKQNDKKISWSLDIPRQIK